MLSQRLHELEESGVVRHSTEGAAAYELTERGQELHSILLQLGEARFTVEVRDGAIAIGRGAPLRPTLRSKPTRPRCAPRC